MKKKPTITFRLGEDFYDKLETFTQKFLNEGFELFKKEFKQIDPFYKKAMKDISDRNDISFRRSPKSKYLMEAVYFQIMDFLDKHFGIESITHQLDGGLECQTK